MWCTLVRCVSMWPIYARTGTLSPSKITPRKPKISWLIVTPRRVGDNKRTIAWLRQAVEAAAGCGIWGILRPFWTFFACFFLWKWRRSPENVGAVGRNISKYRPKKRNVAKYRVEICENTRIGSDFTTQRGVTASCGQTAAGCGRLQQAVEAVAGCGRLRQAVAGYGRLRQAAAGCGGLPRAAVGCGRMKGAIACQNSDPH